MVERMVAILFRRPYENGTPRDMAKTVNSQPAIGEKI
jgi:hypothetical protein